MNKIFRARDFRPDPHRDIDDEYQCHLELKIEDLVTQGIPEEEARERAHRDLQAARKSAGRDQAEAHTSSRIRRQGILEVIESLWRDVRFGLRGMAKSPGFTLIAVLSLSIGVGSNTAVFSVVNGLFFRPPAYAEPESLVQIWTGMADERPDSDSRWSEFQGLLEVEGPFEDVGAFDGIFTGLRDPNGTRPAFVEAMTPNLFPLLGVEPCLGRSFLPDEGSDPAGDPLAILGYRYWMETFQGSRDVLGTTIHVGGIPHTVVGVAPKSISALQTRALVTDIFVPMTMARFLSGQTGEEGDPSSFSRSVKIMARLAPGVSLEAAEARIAGVVREMHASEGRTIREGWGFRLWPLTNQAIEPVIDRALARLGAFLMVVAGLVLLLASTNLANLFLAKGLGRQKELALRLAMGAGRQRLAAQLFTETALLTVLGGAGGFILAQWTLDLLFRFQPNVGVRFALDTSADLRVLLFTLSAAFLASVLFGLIPALAVTHSEITSVLKGVAERGKSGRPRIRGGLVALQMAVSVVLLSAASLFFHSFLESGKVDPGFRPEGAASIQGDLGRSGIQPLEWDGVLDAIQRRAGSTAGIQALGVSDALPLLNRNTINLEIPEMEVPEGGRAPWATMYSVDDGYLAAMGITLISGRWIEEADQEGSERVVLVNQFAAQRFWPGESAIGKEVSVDGVGHRVVGIVGNVKVQFLSDPPEPTVYFSLAQRPASELFFVARGTASTGEMLAALRQAMLEVEPNLLILQSQTLQDRLGINLYPIRLAAAYLGTFGLLALLLAAIGLYGVVSLSVSRRTKEVGIRMSVGADAWNVVGLVFRGSLRPVVIGAMIGLGLAVALGKLIESFLFGVKAADPVTLMVVPVLLGSVAVLAAFFPARRASRVDPVVALKTE